MSTTSLEGLALDLDIVILNIDRILLRRQGRRRLRESLHFVPMLVYVRRILIEIRRMLGDGRRYRSGGVGGGEGGGGGGRGVVVEVELEVVEGMEVMVEVEIEMEVEDTARAELRGRVEVKDCGYMSPMFRLCDRISLLLGYRCRIFCLIKYNILLICVVFIPVLHRV